MKFRSIVMCGVVGTLAACSPTTDSNPTIGSGESVQQARIESRLSTSREVYHSLLTAQDGGVPEELLKRAQCVAVLPNVVKAAFIGGGRFGQGVVTCREQSGGWSAPAFVQLTGGSIGWQIGAEAADVVLFFTGRDAKQSVINPNGLTLGADIGISAGPIGRKADAKTDFSSSGIFSYAQSKGLFAGVSVEGAIFSPDWETNRAYYGRSLSTKDIIVDGMAKTVPHSAEQFLAVLPRGSVG